MNPALLFLVRRSFVNGVLSKLRRLRNPRYLIPTLVGVAYFGLLFGTGAMDRGGDHGPPLPGGARDRTGSLLMEWGMAAAFLLLAASAWLLPSKGPPLAFLEADVEMLFPAPLTRRELVRYKLLDMQKYYLPLVVLFSLIYGLRDGPVGVIRIVLGGLLAFNLIAFHNIGAKLTRQSLLDHGWSGWKSRGPVLGLVAGLAALIWFGAPPLPGLGAGKESLEPLLDWVVEFGRSPAGLALFPFRLPARMFLAPDLPSFLLHALPVLLLLGVLYFWVDRTDAAFEEAAAAQAKVFASRIAAARKGRLGRTPEPGKKVRRSPLRLAPTGPPETAFVWRSLTETFRHVSPRLLIIVLVMTACLLPAAAEFGGERKGVAVGPALVTFICLVFSGLLVLGGPTLLGCNLRQDLEMAETLKSLPIPGPRLFRAYLAGAIAPSAAIAVILLLVAAVMFPSSPNLAVTPAWRLAGFMAAVSVQPALMGLSALVDSGAALLFPGWVRPAQGPAQGGMEGMGYGIVTMGAKFLLVGLGGGIPVALGAGVAFAAGAVGGELLLPAGVMAGGFLAAAGIHTLIWIASEALGGRFDALDPSEEGLLPV